MQAFLRKYGFFLLIAIIYAMLLVLNLLTPMSTDDYAYLYHMQTKERVVTLADMVSAGRVHYMLMNGRIFTNVIFTQAMLWLGKIPFSFINALVYVAFIMGIYLLVKGEKRKDWLLLLAIHSAVFLFAPVFGITMLWLNGSCNYLWGTTLIMYAILPFGRAVLSDEVPKIGLALQCLFVLAALAAGNITENTSTAMLALMVLCLGLLLLQKKRVPLFLLVSLAMALVGYKLLFSSTGLHLDTRAPSSLGGYLNNFSVCMNRLWDKRWLLYAYALFFFLTPKTDTRRRLFSLFLVACGLLANVAMIVPSYYPARADFGWVIFFLAACGVLLPAFTALHGGALWRTLAAGLALTAALNFLWVLPVNYDRYCQNEALIADVIAQRDAGVTEVVTFGIRSRSSYDIFCDGIGLSANPEYWPNLCFAKYYGVQSIAVSEELY